MCVQNMKLHSVLKDVMIVMNSQFLEMVLMVIKCLGIIVTKKMSIVFTMLFFSNLNATLYDNQIINFIYPKNTEIREYNDKSGAYITLTSNENNVITIQILNSFNSLLKVAKKNAQETKKTLGHYRSDDSKFSLIDNNKYHGTEELLEKFNFSIFFQKVIMFRHYFLKKYKDKYIVIIVQGVNENYNEVMQKANSIILSILKSMESK